jgi:putative Holliday junction resolvase
VNFIGIDYGEKRIGLSVGDDELCIAVPLKPIVHVNRCDVFSVLLNLVIERKIDLVLVGYPINMDNSVGFKAKEVDAFIAKLEKIIDVPVERIDERLTTVQADGVLGPVANRKSMKSRIKSRRSGAIDSMAAAIILQDYLDSLGRKAYDVD